MIATEIDLLEELTLKNAVVNWNAAKVRNAHESNLVPIGNKEMRC